MSLALNPIQTVRVVDPVLKFNEHRDYAILTGGAQTSWKPVISTSYSNSSAQFTAPPPSPKIAIDRNMLIKYPVTLQFTGTAPVGQNLLQTGYDAFRAYPIANITNTLTVTINNTSVSINMSDVINPLLKYHTPECLRDSEYSLTPTMNDQYQNYQDGVNTSRNPLAAYGDNTHEMARGSVVYSQFVNTNTSATVSAILTEPIFLSPFVFGKGQQPGFIGVQNLDFNFNFVSDLSRLWSHSSGSNSTITNITVTLGQPTLLFKYITPKELQYIPRSAVYPYFVVDRYPTDANAPFTPNQILPLSTNNIQLQSIPRRMYIFARQRNADRNYTSSDVYFSIESIRVNWNNFSGLLSSASKEQLYKMSVKNGVNMSWTQWSGGPITVASGSANNQYGTMGSVLCIEFGTDIGLSDIECPGMLGTYQLQIDATVKNCNVGPHAQTITPTLYILVVNEGTFTIQDNRSVAQIGVVSKQDALDAQTSPFVDYNEIKSVYGGDFFSGMKDVGSTIWSGLQKAAPYIEKGLDIAGKVAPIAMPLMMGLGDEYSGEGGVLTGGRRRKKKRGGAMMSRDELRHRLLK